jgi:hypothetical protein
MTKAIRDQLTEVEGQLADAGRVNIFGDLIAAQRERQDRLQAVTEVWDSLGLDRQRAVISELMTIKLHPVGKGRRIFRPETIEIIPRIDAD